MRWVGFFVVYIAAPNSVSSVTSPYWCHILRYPHEEEDCFPVASLVGGSDQSNKHHRIGYLFCGAGMSVAACPLVSIHTRTGRYYSTDGLSISTRYGYMSVSIFSLPRQ